MTPAAAAFLRRQWRKLLAAALVLAVLAAAWAVLPVDEWARDLTGRIAALGVPGYLVFAAAYVVLASIGVPRTPLSVAAGVVFPFGVALSLVVAASAVTNFVTFELARHLARDWVARKVTRIPDADRVLAAVHEEGFVLVLLVRMNPLIPAIVKDFGFGTTGVRLHDYMLGSVLGSFPGMLAYVYIGWVGGAAMTSDESGPEGFHAVLMGAGIVVSIVLVVVLTRHAQRILERRSTREADA